jgi:hypothetical protein
MGDANGSDQETTSGQPTAEGELPRILGLRIVRAPGSSGQGLSEAAAVFLDPHGQVSPIPRFDMLPSNWGGNMENQQLEPALVVATATYFFLLRSVARSCSSASRPHSRAMSTRVSRGAARMEPHWRVSNNLAKAAYIHLPCLP